MKKPLALFIALLIGTQLFAQTTPSEKMEDFMNNKAAGFSYRYVFSCDIAHVRITRDLSFHIVQGNVAKGCV